MPDLSQELLASSAKFPKWQRDSMRRVTTYAQMALDSTLPKAPTSIGVGAPTL